MRRIGIIGAMEVEVEKLKARMENVEITRRASMEFYAGTLEGKNVVVVRSGIGKVNAAVCTQILIDEFEAEAGRSFSGGSCDQYRYCRKPECRY